MNTYQYNSYLIKSKLLSKIDIIYINFMNNNNYYIKNLKDFIDRYIDDNKCNTHNNKLLCEFMHNTNLWNINNINIKKEIYDDMSKLIYSYDITDIEMYDFLGQLEGLII